MLEEFSKNEFVKQLTTTLQLPHNLTFLLVCKVVNRIKSLKPLTNRGLNEKLQCNKEFHS